MVLTRFNIPWPRTDKNGVTHDHLGEWLRDRIEIFENYCLPSMIGQTEQNFRWLLLFDYRTPKHIFEKLDAYKNIEICLVDKKCDESHGELSKRVVKDYTESLNIDYLITTRLDNDDMLHYRFIENVKNYFLNHAVSEPIIIQFPKGVDFDFIGKKWCRIEDFKSNAYISFIEKFEWYNIQTVMNQSHRDMADHFKITDLTMDIGWCRNVHDTNLLRKLVKRKIWYLNGLKSLKKQGFKF